MTQARTARIGAEVRRLLDEGQVAAALATIDDAAESSGGLGPELLLLRSEVRFALADPVAGRADLEQAIREDPTLRQAFLNLGALEISQQNWEAAVAAFERARDLDPSAADNALNLGAALLFAGRVDEAVGQFDRYLGDDPAVESLILVAKNYSVAGQSGRALDLLGQAIERDEMARMRIRTDPSFDRLLTEPRMQRLLATDSYRVPRDHHQTFFRLPEVGYEIDQGRALAAVIDALRSLDLPIDPRIEVTVNWSLVHGEVRVKVSPDAEQGGTRVDLSAGPGRYSRQRFIDLSRELYAQVQDELADDPLPLGRTGRPRGGGHGR